MNKFDKEITMSDSFNLQFPYKLDDNFIPSRQEIQRILREEECLVEGSDGMEHLAVEVPDVFTAGCEYILKKLGYEQCEENGMWGYLSKTTADSDDDNFDARFDKIVPYVCKENHPLYVVYKLGYASSELQKQCKYCGNVVYIGTDTEEELKTFPCQDWFAPSDAEDRCGMINGVIKVVRDANLNGTKTAVVAYVDPRSNETMASLTVNIA